jgi:predicted restriction endonuclease
MLLLEQWSSRCAVTKLAMPAVLMASHIKPWRCSTNFERLDRYNGLLLAPQYDKLFDLGFISFEDDGSLVPSPALPKNALRCLGVTEPARLTLVAEKHRRYLAYHRNHVFVHRESQE